MPSHYRFSPVLVFFSLSNSSRPALPGSAGNFPLIGPRSNTDPSGIQVQMSLGKRGRLRSRPRGASKAEIANANPSRSGSSPGDPSGGDQQQGRSEIPK